jgi:hypothetical protein
MEVNDGKNLVLSRLSTMPLAPKSQQKRVKPMLQGRIANKL